MCYPKIIEFTGCNGCDKKYYHNLNDEFGWLEFKESSKKNDEDECYNALKDIKGIFLPKRISNIPPENMPNLKTNEIIQAQCGCYIQHLKIKKTLKPIMHVFEFKPDEYGITASDKKNAIEDLEKIREEKTLSEILKNCGELTLAFELNVKHFYLLDYGKGDATSNIDGIKKGLTKMIETLKSM